MDVIIESGDQRILILSPTENNIDREYEPICKRIKKSPLVYNNELETTYYVHITERVIHVELYSDKVTATERGVEYLIYDIETKQFSTRPQSVMESTVSMLKEAIEIVIDICSL